MPFTANLKGLTTREAIADAVYRTTSAYDENDPELLASALASDVVFEAAGQTMNGLEEVKTANFNKVGQMATTHFVTNMRVNVDGDSAKTASLTCNALAQHYPPGKGVGEDDRRLLAGTKYAIDLVKESDGLWKMKKWVLTIVWTEGDFSVLA